MKMKIKETGDGKIILGKYGACMIGFGCYNFDSDKERQSWIDECDKKRQEIEAFNDQSNI